MGIIEEVRLDREDLARVLKKHTGIRKLVEDLYPDRAHFIYELLQNAEDTGATEVTFRLEEKSLFFEHNGRPFEAEDIYAITDIGEGTKGTDDDKIGQFGVGFKAVFAYSETPFIWSPTYSFKISELVLPSVIEGRGGKNTCFEFPFNNPKKTPVDAYIEIKRGLEELAETTLLFLSGLESIHWQIEGRPAGEVLRIEHSPSHIEVLKQVDGKKTTNSHFLRFSEPVKGLENQGVAIAFELDFLPDVIGFDSQIPLHKQLKIVPAGQGRVAVFFPAVKETSGLRFHLHGPFVPELSRASIKETLENNPLFEQIAVLGASSLHTIRDLKLLTGEFLGVLPNSQDTIPKRYEPIRAAIIAEMNQSPLTPTYSKGHAAAQYLLQSKASLKTLLTEKDLEFLVEYEDVSPKWAVAASQKSSNADRFLSSLAIRTWDLNAFVEELLVKAKAGVHYPPPNHERVIGPDALFMEWLGSKSDQWHQIFYALLFDDYLGPSLYKRRQLVAGIKSLRIVRLTNGIYNVGEHCYFPGKGPDKDKVLPRVAGGTYTSGRSKAQKESAYKFLEEIGVREVGEVDEIGAILKQRYSHKSNNYAESTYVRDLKRFVRFVEKESGNASIFNSFYIFKIDDSRWVKPDELFIDEPFIDTGLSEYYNALADSDSLLRLPEFYLDFGIKSEAFVRFARLVGVKCELGIHKESTANHCLRGELWTDYGKPRVKWTTTAINIDWIIPHIDEVLKKPSKALFKLIWKTMSEADPKVLVACFRPNQQYEVRTQPSSLVLALRGKRRRWVYQEGGEFVSPENACFEKLPHGFLYDEDVEWLKAIRFGNIGLQLSEKRKKIQAAAKDVLGTDDPSSVEDAMWFISLSKEERHEFRAKCQSRHAVELPEAEPRNPELRSERVGKQAVNAPERTSEQRTRSVSTGLGEVKQAAEQYLRQQYTNSDGDMICQVCKKKLPFKLSDGNYYVEKVEFLKELQKRHAQNYLALCPNHAAMFQHVNGSRELLKDMIIELDSNHLEVILANEDSSIYFTKTHVADLKAVIVSDAEIAENTEDNREPADADFA